jgi:hypothetical protein
MPGLNRKGPMWEGPMSGRKMGRCTNFGANLKDRPVADSEKEEAEDTAAGKITEEKPPLDEGRGFGFGHGRRFGPGRGRGGRGMGCQHRFRGGC